MTVRSVSTGPGAVLWIRRLDPQGFLLSAAISALAKALGGRPGLGRAELAGVLAGSAVAGAVGVLLTWGLRARIDGSSVEPRDTTGTLPPVA